MKYRHTIVVEFYAQDDVAARALTRHRDFVDHVRELASGFTTHEVTVSAKLQRHIDGHPPKHLDRWEPRTT